MKTDELLVMKSVKSLRNSSEGRTGIDAGR